MNVTVKNAITPEEEELRKKVFEINELEQHLIQLELSLITQKTELHTFELLYLQIVGVRLAKLDEINASIAEFIAKEFEGDIEKRSFAKEAQTQAFASAHAVGEINSNMEINRDFKPKESIKALYREAAKLVHPDLGFNDNDRELRSRVMAEINAAYRDEDEERIKKILNDWKSSPDLITGIDIGAKIIKAIRRIAQLAGKISTLEEDIVFLENSDLSVLCKKVNEARTKNRDLLEEMAIELDKRIEEKQKFLLGMITT